MDVQLIICLGLSFLVTYLLTPIWIRAAHRVRLTGKDMNKFKKPKVAEMGGVTVISGFLTGVLFYIGLITFYFLNRTILIFIFAATLTVLIIAIIGMLDDILGWKTGLRQRHKPLLTLTAALPMMAVKAGTSEMNVPFFGWVDLGILYPLIIVPLIIMVAANGFNMLAGYNGLEAGMGIMILGTLGFVSWLTGNSWITVLSLCMVFPLLAFLRFNWYPARIFPGDSLTYSVGALIASIAILGNMEKILVILFLPYFLDFLLPLRKKFRVEAFAKVREDGSLEMPYNGIYDVAHLAIFLLQRIKDKVYERDVVIFILSMELGLVLLVGLTWVV